MIFSKFFPKKKAPAPERVGKLSSNLSASILAVIGKKGIPTMASSAQRAFKLSIDPNAATRDFVEVIEADEALSSRVIKIANSVFYERDKKSETIEECVNVLGINELRNLLSATTLSEIFPCRNPMREQFWTNDIATAITGKILANKIQYQKEDIIFTGGLLHDIGKLLLLQRLDKVYSDIAIDAINNENDFCGAEESHYVFNHTEVGQLIAEKWNFSEDLKDIIANHHQIPQLRENGSLNGLTPANIIWAADIISHALGLGHPANFTRFQNRACEKLDTVCNIFQISQEEKKDLLQDVKRTFELEKDLYLRH